MKIRFGIQIEPQFGFDYVTVEKIALNAEKLGYNSIWSSDHLFLHDKAEQINCMEAWTLLSALASKTSHLRLGTLVTCNSYRYPSLLAKIASTIDLISNGRLEFGIGAGWKEIEFKAFGISFPSIKERFEQLEETLQIVKLLWTEPKTTFNGKHYTIKDAFSAPKPIQKPHPPIFIGGTGEKHTLKLVAKYGDYCNFGWFFPHEKISHLLDVLKMHCKDINRDYDSVGKSFFANVLVCETEDQINDFYIKVARQRNISVEDFKKRLGNGAFIGTPEEVQNRFQHLIDLGFSYFQIVYPYGLDYTASNDFARLVMNKLA